MHLMSLSRLLPGVLAVNLYEATVIINEATISSIIMHTIVTILVVLT